MRNNLLLIIFLSLIFFNCENIGSSKKHLYSTIFIDNTKIDSVKDISHIIDTIIITPIIEQPSNHFSSIFKILFTKNGYLIYDRFNTNKVFLFDSLGQFKKVVCKMGTAINDPMNMNDIWLNYKGELEVYDFAQMKILRFDSNFNYVSYVKAPELNHFVSLHNISNSDNYIGYSNYNYYNKPIKEKLYNIAFMDSTLKITNVDLFFSQNFQGIPWSTYNQHFFPYENSLRFIKAYDNIVYRIADDNIGEKYRIVYKKNDIGEKDIMSLVKKKLSLFKDRKTPPIEKFEYLKKYTFLKGPWIESKNLIIIHSVDTIGELGSSFISFFDKSKNSSLFSIRKMVESKKYMMEIPPFQYFNSLKNEYVSVIPGIILKKLLFKNSSFRNLLSKNPYDFYIIKTKLLLN